jgi:hypothetical protein
LQDKLLWRSALSSLIAVGYHDIYFSRSYYVCFTVVCSLQKYCALLENINNVIANQGQSLHARQLFTNFINQVNSFPQDEPFTHALMQITLCSAGSCVRLRLYFL